MNIVIVGAGVVGQSLAEQLSIEGHQVSVVDQNRAMLRAIGEKLDVLCVHGNAGMPSVLKRAGVRKSEMVIAVTDVDEVNIVVGMLASRFGAKHIIVRIRNREYLGDNPILPLQELGIHQIINPDLAIVDALVRTIEIPGSYHVATLADGKLLILGFIIPEDSPAAGLTMAELREVGSLETFLVLDINRGDQTIVPKGSDKLEKGDVVHILCSSRTVVLVPPIIHTKSEQVDVVIIAGASRIGIQLAEAIQEKVERVVLIEGDRTAAEEAAAQLKKTMVVKGDITDLDVLQEANLDRCDLFCAVSDDDQANTMSALLAKKHSRTVAAVLVHQPEYVPVVNSLGIEIVINPRLATVGQILTHVRRGHVHSVTRLTRGRAEILEMQAPKSSPAVGVPLKKLRFPEQALLGAIVHNGVMSIPTGDSVIAPDDTVVVFALPEAISTIEKLFSRRRWI
jgi:trk system potassium uptake protein